MSDADDLAQRYLALWMQYLTALLADPRVIETLRRWQDITEQFSSPAPYAKRSSDKQYPAWPPFFAPFGLPTVTESSTDQIAELSRRVEELERRLGMLERRPSARRPRRQ